MQAAGEGLSGRNTVSTSTECSCSAAGAYLQQEMLICGFPASLQCIHGVVTTTGKVVGDRHKAQGITANVKDLMCR